MTVLSDFPYLDPVIELDARPGYLALVWVTEPARGDRPALLRGRRW